MSIEDSHHPPQNNFSLDGYRFTLSSLIERGYRCKLFDEVIHEDEPYIYLRHDIDLDPQCALTIAEIESIHNMKASFFFQLRSPLYNVLAAEVENIIKRINELGHRVGLHFNPSLYKTKLDVALKYEIEIFTKFYPFASSQTVSIHRPTNMGRYLSPICPEIRHTYEKEFVHDIGYFSDSGGEWRYGDPLNSESFCSRLPMQVLVHPAWWVLEGRTASEKTERLLAHMIKKSHDSLRLTIPKLYESQSVGS